MKETHKTLAGSNGVRFGTLSLQNQPGQSSEDNQYSGSGSLAIDNFDILMMLLSPIVSYLMAETFSISGLLAIMCCGFLQSMYAQQNLERERSNLLSNTFKALSYSCRSICDIMIGISLPLHISVLRDLGTPTLVTTLVLIFFVSYGISHFTIKRFRIAGLIHSEMEGFILFTQSNTRGLLGYTLALQNFNARISAIALIYIVVSTLIFEPVQNLFISKNNFIMNKYLRDSRENKFIFQKA